MRVIQTRPGFVTFIPTGGTVETWEEEELQYLQAQEEEERERQEAEDTMDWHLNFSRKPREANERGI